ncbi:hypothetical protein CSOJ01_14493 [Colletotrichum sojae]|uniref:Uncharacterized protein n=1 Tax=Colletotrichum sojae TaxID=2175907 RepID=A0A8H6MJS4_9PEZI|nr:hypothetical protein CSOJ01_14493 [Colletotrichum sojae]
MPLRVKLFKAVRSEALNPFAGRRSDRAPSSHGVQTSNAAASERTCQTAEDSAIRSQAGGGASWFPQRRRGETSLQAETGLTVPIPRYDGPGILVFGPLKDAERHLREVS